MQHMIGGIPNLIKNECNDAMRWAINMHLRYKIVNIFIYPGRCEQNALASTISYYSYYWTVLWNIEDAKNEVLRQ